MYGTHTLAFQRIFVRMKIISLIFIRFPYVSLIRNSVTGPLDFSRRFQKSTQKNGEFGLREKC
jgi:hypothetical protein